MTVSACPPIFEHLEQHCPEQRAEQPADHQHRAHMEIDPAAPHMREHAGDAGTCHLRRG
jgi:hypothetical protein